MKQITLPKKALDCIQQIKKVGVSSYIVGGAVRDAFFGIASDDIDICLVGVNDTLSVKLTLNEFSDSVVLAGKDFPCWIADFGGQKIDFALARKERSVGEGHTDFSVETENVSLRDDLARRDLTINAIAYNPISGVIVDPHKGVEDIKNRVAKPCSDAFTEDPLRVLRAADFISRYNLFADKLLVEMCKIVKGSLASLPKERVSKQFLKWSEKANHPRLFFDFLSRVGALEVLFPEIDALQSIEQDPEWHPEGNVYEHTMQCVEQAKTPFMRIVMLCHDLGKITTTERIGDKITARGHDVAGVPITVKMLERVFCTVDKTVHKKIACMVKHHMIHANQNISRRLVFKTLRDLHKHGLTFAQLREVCRCDVSGRSPLKGFTPDIGDEYYHEWLTSEDDLLSPIVNGDVLINHFNMPVGKGIGWVLDRALRLQDRGKLTKNNWESCTKNLINSWESFPARNHKRL